MATDKPIKVYVHVTASFDEYGKMKPISFVWEDGQKYVIEKVLDCKPAAAMRAGGQGDRFTIRVNGREKYLFFERCTRVSGDVLGKWFLERKPA